MITLYSGPLSLFSRKVEIALREKGLHFERVMVPFNQTTGYDPKHPEVLALECEWATWMGLPVMDVGELVPALAGFKFAPNVLSCNNGTAAILAGLVRSRWGNSG